MGMTADLVRGAALTALALVVFSPMAERSLSLWSTDSRVSRAMASATSGAGAH